jgi:acetyl-CoA acyltransferase
MHDAVIVSAVRTPVGKAPAGALHTVRPDDMAATVIGEALRRVPAVDAATVEDVILGCAMPEAEQGLNVARIASLRAGIPVGASAVTINRFCSSGLQSIAFGAERIMCGFAHTIVAGGTESMSMIPMGGHKVSPNPTLVETYPDVYLSTGLVAENHARQCAITREEQDQYALRSHQRAIAAIDAGRFRDETVPLTVQVALPADGDGGRPVPREFVFVTAFHAQGTVTAGNSSQTSDGAAAVVLMSAERARDLGLPPLARFVAFATVGVQPEFFGIGPVPAITKALKLAGLTLEQIDLIELNEAFASQVLADLRQLDIDPDRLNVNGGAIALGHPLGCTGAKLTTTLVYEMRRRNARYGMVTMCVGGGMGAAGIFERM